MNAGRKSFIAILVSTAMLLTSPATAGMAQEKGAYRMDELYQEGSFVESYSPIVSRHRDDRNRAWRDGFVSGNGMIGYVTSGEPYSDTFIYQNMFFNYPSADPREIPEELTGQLSEARENVFNFNDKWEVKDKSGRRRRRTYFYSFHPGHQLRITSDYQEQETGYVRWTNYETAETGVRFTDSRGEWQRTAFTSRCDGVSITKLTKSSTNELLNLKISIDDIDDMPRSDNGLSKVQDQRYKKIVPDDASYIAQISHYPVYDGSELRDGGYCGLTRVLVEGASAVQSRVESAGDDPMLLGNDAAIRIENAEAVYLVTALDRSSEMTGAPSPMDAFASMQSYDLLDKLAEETRRVCEKYTHDGAFDYDAALAPSARLHQDEFQRVRFGLEGDEDGKALDNAALIAAQRSDPSRINHEFLRRSYDQARYALVCCSGSSAPRLYGMWTGEWNLGWRGIYTLDANVNLQVSSINTGGLDSGAEGYITYFLRHTPDFMRNAEKSYGMHDALQPSVNTDADRAMQVEYDNDYPFQYWNAGASWCLLPIYEYWQCNGNRQIPINRFMRIDDLQRSLGVEDGGLSDDEFAAIKERGWLDLEKDILLPLLTKQANFWEQIVTPCYYMDANGVARHDGEKTELLDGERYMIIPSYSPENHPVGYNSTIAANATMDITAAKDGLDMVCALEKAVGRDGWETAVKKWQKLKDSIADYQYDPDGALKEWAMSDYVENNNHRHLSHLYAAWPAYETQSDPDLARAANIALDNRNRYNTGDATAGHGWIHKALVEARLKRGDGMAQSLLKMMGSNAYYPSLMTDHDTNRRNDTYCTDTAFGTLGAVNESLAYSNTGEIEILPSLPRDWTKGSVDGLMARTRAEITSLSWDIDTRTANVTLTSSEDGNRIRLGCGEEWTAASLDGTPVEKKIDARGSYLDIVLEKDQPVSVAFTLSETPDGTYLIARNGQYLTINDTTDGSPAVWDGRSDSAYWNVENIHDGWFFIRNCATGKYLTREGDALIQKNKTGEENQLWNGSEFEMQRQTFQKEVTVIADKIVITVNGKETDSVELQQNDIALLGIKTVPEDAPLPSLTVRSSNIACAVPYGNHLAAYAPGSCTIQASDGMLKSELKVHVNGPGKQVINAAVAHATSSPAWSSDWEPDFVFDGIPSTAYSSKDDAPAKFLKAELAEPEPVSAVYVIGRYTPADGDGAFANRINGAKIYASNDADTPGELVGEVSGVTATHSYIPQRIDLDTGGRSYQYFTLYFDTVNNGGKISLAVAELSFVVESEQEISFTPGDVDNDGSIHLSDAVLALKLSVAGSDGDTGHSQAFLSADVDGDGNVTTADVLKILKKANKKHVEELDG